MWTAGQSSLSKGWESHTGRRIAALAFWQIITPKIAWLLLNSSWHLPTAPTPRKWWAESVFTHCCELEQFHSLCKRIYMRSECNAGKGKALMEWFHSLWLFLLWWGPYCDGCQYSGTGAWVRGFWPPLMWSTLISLWLNSLTYCLGASVSGSLVSGARAGGCNSSEAFLDLDLVFFSAALPWTAHSGSGKWAEQDKADSTMVFYYAKELWSVVFTWVNAHYTQTFPASPSLGVLSHGQLPPLRRCIPGKLCMRGTSLPAESK